MAKAPATASVKHTPEEMMQAITMLNRRIKDLDAFDINAISKQFDPSVSVLANKIKQTLEDVVGKDTSEFNRYVISSYNTLPLFMGGHHYPLNEVKANVIENINSAKLKLQALVELLEERLADSVSNQPTKTSETLVTSTPATRRVFIVHGHDSGAKETLARYLSKLELTPIILHEQASEGKTVIEKFEANANVDFAVILFTPDDVGYPANDPNAAKSRARQNVVLELGFFMAALGRHRVCVLKDGDIEIPSDYTGVVYLPMDTAGHWRFQLAKEMKAAGMIVDLNNAI